MAGTCSSSSSVSESDPSILCLCCREDITNQPDNRRSLQGTEAAKRVCETWMKVVEYHENTSSCVEESDYIHSLSTLDLKTKKVCRKCFSCLDRYYKSCLEVNERFHRSISIPTRSSANEPPVKKSRQSDHTLMYFRPSDRKEEHSSPPVSVSCVFSLCISSAVDAYKCVH